MEDPSRSRTNSHISGEHQRRGVRLRDDAPVPAKKNVKESMKKRLNIMLKGENINNNANQFYQSNIESVVDFDTEDVIENAKEKFVTGFVESLGFRWFILFIILTNSLFIALQTNKSLEENYGYLFTAADRLFLTIFICEILLKWYGGFFIYWKVGWNLFDFSIVAASLIGPSFAFNSSTRVLRILRVLRALRSLRSISVLRPLQLVVTTILHSLPEMANILLLLLMLMFITAVIGVKLFAEHSSHFTSIKDAMFALFICTTLDGWVEVFNTLRDSQYTLAAIYFVVFILIGAFTLINLVVAVVVTNLERAIAEQDELDMQQRQEETGSIGEYQSPVTYDLEDLLHKKYWKHQKPVEVPYLPGLKVEKVQNYMILVAAMEDNLTEQRLLRDELVKVGKELFEWNSPVEEEVTGPTAMSSSKEMPKSDSYPALPTFEMKPSVIPDHYRKASVLANILMEGKEIVSDELKKKKDLEAHILKLPRRSSQKRGFPKLDLSERKATVATELQKSQHARGDVLSKLIMKMGKSGSTASFMSTLSFKTASASRRTSVGEVPKKMKWQKETEAGGIEGDRCNKQLASVSSKNLVNNIAKTKISPTSPIAGARDGAGPSTGPFSAKPLRKIGEDNKTSDTKQGDNLEQRESDSTW